MNDPSNRGTDAKPGPVPAILVPSGPSAPTPALRTSSPDASAYPDSRTPPLRVPNCS
ncbi:hypothetical protein M0Q28_05415 [Patescibacteria group bacterium]|nr:hypothetical protein [Patescibacteria group bacterium]